ncbi:MAG: hypothetical protein J3K34DRAFT_519522 [Monoraphidium minutum]|nr:MAG: hypothetical protein J3K34DRAFT_519522 [Monoraphidium minutum]
MAWPGRGATWPPARRRRRRGAAAAAALLVALALLAAVAPGSAAKPKCKLIPGCDKCSDASLARCSACKEGFELDTESGRCVCPMGYGSYLDAPGEEQGGPALAFGRRRYWARRRAAPAVQYPGARGKDNKLAGCAPCPGLTAEDGRVTASLSLGGPIETARCALPGRHAFYLSVNVDRACNDDTKWALIVYMEYTAQAYYHKRGGLGLIDEFTGPGDIACSNTTSPNDGGPAGAYLVPVAYSGLSDVGAAVVDKVNQEGGVCGFINEISGIKPNGDPCPIGYTYKGIFYPAGNIFGGGQGGAAALTRPAVP